MVGSAIAHKREMVKTVALAPEMKSSSATLDQLCINSIRVLAIDAVQKANSGHPGMPMGMAPVAYLLFTRYLRHNPKNPHWPGRDRFVLSAGHGSMLLYASLHLSGYDLPLDELKRFRQLGSRTPCHPENYLTAGVETTTGPLGQGFGNGVGMAIAAKHTAARFERGASNCFDQRIFAIVSDGDLMEGISSEAASIAGHLGLGNIIYLYDDNHVTFRSELLRPAHLRDRQRRRPDGGYLKRGRVDRRSSGPRQHHLSV